PSAYRTSFPRIRGDRPPRISLAFPPQVFPPHTRGSTCTSLRDASRAEVSPAYAGIDLQWGTLLEWRQSFPRIRGDRPDVKRRCYQYGRFPPHTRGSTSQRHMGP